MQDDTTKFKHTSSRQSNVHHLRRPDNPLHKVAVYVPTWFVRAVGFKHAVRNNSELLTCTTPSGTCQLPICLHIEGGVIVRAYIRRDDYERKLREEYEQSPHGYKSFEVYKASTISRDAGYDDDISVVWEGE